MANTPILSLPVAVSLDGTENLECTSTPNTSTAVSKRITSGQIAGLASTVPATATVGLSLFGNSSTVAKLPTAIVGTAGQVALVNDAGTAVLFGRVNLSNTASVTGVLGVADGGTGTGTAFSSGSVVFSNVSGSYAQNNASFSWNNTNGILSLPTLNATSAAITGTANVTGAMTLGSTLNVTGNVTFVVPLRVASGGSGTGTAFTLGSVVFATASGNYAQDNGSFYYDGSNKRLGIGIAPPIVAVHALGNIGAVDAGPGLDAGYSGKFMSTRSGTSTGQHINLVRAGVFVWSIGYDYNTSNFLVSQGQGTDSNFTGGVGGILLDTNFNAYIPKGNLTVGTASVSGNISATGTATILSGTALATGGTTGSGLLVSSTANFGTFAGNGTPTMGAAKGSLYLRSDGNTTTNRAYINTNGTQGWAAILTAS